MSPDARQARSRAKTPPTWPRRAAAELERAARGARTSSIAALIVEPLVQCAAGMAMHDPAYLRARARAVRPLRGAPDRRRDRGRLRAHRHLLRLRAGARIWPDFLCLSKGISGGYLPLSLVLSRDAIYEAFLDDDVARGFLHSHSYTGNALACRAALAVLDRFEHDDVLQRNRHAGRALTAALAAAGEPTRASSTCASAA